MKPAISKRVISDYWCIFSTPHFTVFTPVSSHHEWSFKQRAAEPHADHCEDTQKHSRADSESNCNRFVNGREPPDTCGDTADREVIDCWGFTLESKMDRMLSSIGDVTENSGSISTGQRASTATVIF